jgi:hypothetical protein
MNPENALFPPEMSGSFLSWREIPFHHGYISRQDRHRHKPSGITNLISYNPRMNFLKSPSLLLNCCIAIMLLLSLWMSGVQDLLAHNVLDNGDIELTLDADSHSNDSFEQTALISPTPSVLYVAHNADYPQLLARSVPSNCFTPPDRPPAQFV